MIKILPDKKAIMLLSIRYTIVFLYYLKPISYWEYEIQVGEHLFDNKYLINITTPIFSITCFHNDSI